MTQNVLLLKNNLQKQKKFLFPSKQECMEKTKEALELLNDSLINIFIDDITFQDDIELIKKDLYIYLKVLFEYNIFKTCSTCISTDQINELLFDIVSQVKEALSVGATAGQNRNLLKEEAEACLYSYSVKMYEEIDSLYMLYRKGMMKYGFLDLSFYLKNIEEFLNMAKPGTASYNRLKVSKEKAELITYPSSTPKNVPV